MSFPKPKNFDTKMPSVMRKAKKEADKRGMTVTEMVQSALSGDLEEAGSKAHEAEAVFEAAKRKRQGKKSH